MARRAEPVPSWDELVALMADVGIHHVGVAPATILHRARAELHRRAGLGYDAGMGFTYRNPKRSTDPSRAVEGARSIIVAAIGYGADDQPAPPSQHAGRVARYAWEDYYGPLRVALRTVAKRLRVAGERAVAFADDNSIVDREVAYRGGLGWFGKNANLLVNGVGSFVVLGSIITTADYVPVETPVSDGCGSCRRCIDDCPTGAIVESGVIDANRCLAWLVQKPGTFPVEFREALGDRFYGCDDCQEVCPPSVRLGHHGAVDLDQLDPGHARAEPQSWVDLSWVLSASDDELLDAYGRWYVADRNPRWWRRNSLLALANSADPDNSDVRQLIQRYVLGDDTLLAEHARWALDRLDRRRNGRTGDIGTVVTSTVGSGLDSNHDTPQ